MPASRIALEKEDRNIDHALRPHAWSEYVGQEKVKRNLRIIIDAAKKRKEVMDHVLFSGQAGLGKTTLAYLVGKELGAIVKTTSGPALEKSGDIAAILTNLEPGSVLFIDEAHRMNRVIEEVLYPAMESRALHVMVGKGPSARSLTINLPPFCLIAATTRENLLSGPLRTRFGATLRLDFYDHDDIARILARSAGILGANISEGAVGILAGASRGTPRVANRLLKRARDFADVQGTHSIDETIAQKTLELLEVDRVGLEPEDRKLLRVVIEKFNGGPVGVGTLAAALSEERGVIEDIYEPYLMKLGFLKRTPAGRVVLPAAYEHLHAMHPGRLI
ncbi:MAG: Holliday junction branch migration DNA helicase RuvB [Candidatus Liptonbacteria bacterium]|nr:Holliday junction branch migration DNA helicase RuvB [Candidatus Liptonbacteria bacterium]